MLRHTVDTSSKYKGAYSFSDETAGRTALYFYHPRKLVLENQDAQIAFWHSSNANVVRVYSDGIVEAMSEGIADITAYGGDGKPLQTFWLYTTTSADENILKVTQGDMAQYTKIPFEQIQERINTIADYAFWLYANNVFYDMYEEASNPAAQFSENGLWMQMANADWIFRNLSGICCSVAAGGMYSLVGDYEENGLIYMSGPYGHVISYFKENGQYIVVDFTRNISDGQRGVNEMYRGNVLAYMEAGIGTGATLKEAFENYLEQVGSNFYLDNYIIYGVNLTGLDYYPAEANNWSQGKDFFTGTNRLYVAEGTRVEVLYLADNIDFEVISLARNRIPANMEVVLEPTDVTSTETSMLLLEVPELKAKTGLTTHTFNTEALQSSLSGLSQKKLLQIITLSSTSSSSFSATVKDREPVYLFHPKQLTLKDNAAKVAFWYSSNPNVLRVSGDGKVIAYSEGIADVFACGMDGSIIGQFRLYATTYADIMPLEASVGDGSTTAYKDMYYEDIQEKLNTITDYAGWMYANNLGYDGYREPMPPDTGWVQHNGTSLEWMQMANSNWVFKDYSGICCNAAAGAMYALEGDYEKYGLIFMTGPYGHVINYYMENGCYYVIDFTAVYGGYDIRERYGGNAEAYVKATCGTGATLMEAFQNYISKGNGDFYYENYIIYAMDLTGLDYYPAECNNWHFDTHTEIFVRTNILYVPEGAPVETIYVNEKIKFAVEEVSKTMVPAKMQGLLADRLTR